MIEQALAVATDNAETARKALEQRDALLARIEKISKRLFRDNEGKWCGDWLNEEDHIGNIAGYLVLYEGQLSYSAKQLFQAKQLLEEVLQVREMGATGPMKTKIRAFLGIA